MDECINCGPAPVISDIDGDGVVDFGDVNPFGALFTGW